MTGRQSKKKEDTGKESGETAEGEKTDGREEVWIERSSEKVKV